jgi:hypothetical protein
METAANSSAERLRIEGQSPHVRSRVTNGKTLHVAADGRGLWARRFRDIMHGILGELKVAAADLTEAQRQLVRRAAMLAVACERMEGDAALGQLIDIEQYGLMVDRQARAFRRLGLKTGVTAGKPPAFSPLALHLEQQRRQAVKEPTP